MNVHFSQVDRRSQLSSYLLAAFAIFTVLMFALSLSRQAGLHWSVPSVTVPAAQTQKNEVPLAIPAPRPPADRIQVLVTPAPAGNLPSILVPQVIPVPALSVP